MASKIDHPTINKARDHKEKQTSRCFRLSKYEGIVGIVMASNSIAPEQSLQPVHQPNQAQDAQFFKVPVPPQVQHEITPQNYMYSEKKILGLRLVTFWLSLALCIVIIAGVVGGAVGGVFAHAGWYV
jgi:hypothetical protein